MFSRTLTTSLALAAGAGALAVPPPMVLPADPMQLKSHPPKPMAAGQPKANIELACPSCPLAVGQIHGHPKGWLQGPDSRLQIELTSDGSQLYFNGAPIYPLASTSLSRKLSAKQVFMHAQDAHTHEALYNRPLPLSSGIEVHDQVEMFSFHLDASNIHDMVERIPMRSMDIEIMGLGEKMIKVDTIRVKFSDDKLQIHDVNIIPYGTNDSEAEKNCDTVLCRLRTDLEGKLAALRAKVGTAEVKAQAEAKAAEIAHKAEAQAHEAEAKAAAIAKGWKWGCHGMGLFGKPKAAEGQEASGVDGNAPSAPAGQPMPLQPVFHKAGDAATNKPAVDDAHNLGAARLPGFRGGMDAKFGGYRMHASQHQHAHDHSALHAVVRFLYHIILPVMVGITAGMLVSGIGMLIGQLVVFVCTKLWGSRDDEGYERIDYVFVDENGVEHYFSEDDDDAPDHDEFLPRYEDAQANPPPAFDEAAYAGYEVPPSDEKLPVVEEPETE